MRFVILVMVIVITVIVTLFSVFRTPSFQQLAGRLAADYLSKTYQLDLSIDRLRISDLVHIRVEGLKLNDHRGEPLIDAERLQVRLTDFSNSRRIIELHQLTLEKGAFLLRKYEADTMSNLLIALAGFSGTGDTDTTAGGGPWTITCRELILRDFSFGYLNESRAVPAETINFDDLLLTAIQVELKDITVVGDSVAANVLHVAFSEKSGFTLHDFTARASVSRTGIRAHQALISTNRSALDFDLDFTYEDYSSLGYFLDSVHIDSRFRSSLLTLQDVGYFASELKKMDDPVMFSGRIEGFVSAFAADSFNLSLGNMTGFEGDISMRGLPYFDSTFTVLDIRKFTTDAGDIAAFSLPLENTQIELPSQVSSLGMISLSGTWRGSPAKFKTWLKVSTEAGQVEVSGSYSDEGPGNRVVYAGDISGSGLAVGPLLGTELLGSTDLDLEFQGSGITESELDIELAGWIENLDFKGHVYEKIVVGGEVGAGSFDGKILVMDSSLNMAFHGLVNFKNPEPEFDFTLDILHARFYELNLSEKSTDMDLAAFINADFSGNGPDNFRGALQIRDLVYSENGIEYPMKNFELTRLNEFGQPDRITVRSDYVDGNASGEFTIIGLINDLREFVLFGSDENTGMEDAFQKIDFSFRLKDVSNLTDIFIPELEIAPDAVITGAFDGSRYFLEANVSCEGLIYNGISVKNIDLNGTTRNKKFYVDLSAGRAVLFRESDTSGLWLDNLVVSAESGPDSITSRIRWDNYDELKPNQALIAGHLILSDSGRIEAGIDEAWANFNGNRWEITGTNKIISDSSYFHVDNLDVSKDKEGFVIDGTLSGSDADTLSLQFREWALANFNPLLESSGLEFGGIINGRLGISGSDTIPNIFAALNIADFEFNDVYFGEAQIDTRWIERDSSLRADINIFNKGELTDRYKILGITGSYFPFGTRNNFDLELNAQNLDISVLEPLISSFSSKIEGFASGRLKLTGASDRPAIAGKLKLQRAGLMIDYLNITCYFSDEVEFTENAILFDEVRLYDANTNQAMLSGGIRHRYFSDMELDLQIKPDNFMAMDLNRYQNDVFYGKAFATGNVSLTGPFNNIAIKVDVKTEKGTDVTIPISYSVDVSQTDYIVFSNEADTTPGSRNQDVKVEGVSLDIGMNVTRDANIQIFLPGDIGFIKANGDGGLRMGVDPNGYLTLNGSYKIHTGLFVFSLEQLVSRRFEILEGSSIGWTGDINDAEVNIVARYRLRTSLDGLGISMIDPDAASQKVQVNTDIRMTGNLFNPDLSFGITFPNMPEQTRQAVYAVLDTNDMGLMNQQAISLLVLSSFSSTGTGGTNPVNAAAIVSSSLSSMLSQISNDFNIGINYMPGDRVSDEQLEVALSTQLLNDRLIIDGNLDVTGSSDNSQKTSAIVGDFNIEYKLTPDGRFRVKAFNRSNDLSLYTQYSPYTQGVGIFYRKEFNNIREFFNRPKKVSLNEN